MSENERNLDEMITLGSRKTECYDGKQAQYDYDGGIPVDEDRDDWIKPRTRGIRIG